MTPLARQIEQTMRNKTAANPPRPGSKGPALDLEQRINAAWLRLWRAVYPDIPPPRKSRRPRLKPRRSPAQRPAVNDLLARVLAAWLTLTLLSSGCVGPRPLWGGKTVTSRQPGGLIEQTLVQGQNAAEAARQVQETVKVRSYTVPAGSRLEECRLTATSAGVPLTNVQSVLVSTPMPVVEREEIRARSELGAAQKDTARERGARLSSLKGVVWVGVGLFVFGLATLVWPPLKTVIGSVTTSAALLLGGVALMVLPTLVAGNELLILGIVALAVGAWFLAHRHGALRGIVAASNGGDK
jgi:hypothetical protein